MTRSREIGRKLWRLLVPRNTEVDWPLVPYQPILYTVLWITVLTLLVFGWFHYSIAAQLPTVWVVMMLIGPPLGLVSLWLIQGKSGGIWSYRGFWLRLIVDVAMAFAVGAYCVTFWSVEELHESMTMIAGGALTASSIFCCVLVIRDIRTIFLTERLAKVVARCGIHDARSQVEDRRQAESQ